MALSAAAASIIAAGVTAASSAAGTISTGKMNKRAERLTRESWARDDTAVQRKVRDLEAAGLSKTLAAGGGADNSTPMQVKSQDYSGYAQGIVQAIQLKNELATSAMERERLAAEANKANAEADYTRMSRTDYTTAQTDLLVLNKAKAEAEKARDYPYLRQVEQAIAAKKKEIEVMDLGLEKGKLDLSNLQFDSDYYKSMGYSSEGAASQVGKIAGDVGGFVRHKLQYVERFGKQVYNALRGFF